MEAQTGPNWWPTIMGSVIAAIGIVVSLLINRRNIMSLFPPKLEVIGNAIYRPDSVYGNTEVRWYIASVTLSIREHGKDNIRSFNAIVDVDTNYQEVSLSVSRKEYNISVSKEIGQGYTLSYDNPIGPEVFTFKFIAHIGQRISPKAHIVLKVGRHYVKKPFLLFMEVS